MKTRPAKRRRQKLWKRRACLGLSAGLRAHVAVAVLVALARAARAGGVARRRSPGRIGRRRRPAAFVRFRRRRRRRDLLRTRGRARRLAIAARLLLNELAAHQHARYARTQVAEQALKQREGLVLELVQRVALRIAAQVD